MKIDTKNILTYADEIARENKAVQNFETNI
jgi:hypothetical protein